MIWPCKQDTLEKTPQTSFTCQSKWEKTSFGRRRTRWTNYNEDLGWNCLGLYLIEMEDHEDVMEVMEDHEVWRRNLELLPRNPQENAGNEEKRR